MWGLVDLRWDVSIRNTILLSRVIPNIEIRCINGRLIFSIGITIPGKTFFLTVSGVFPKSEENYFQMQVSASVFVDTQIDLQNLYGLNSWKPMSQVSIGSGYGLVPSGNKP